MRGNRGLGQRIVVLDVSELKDILGLRIQTSNLSGNVPENPDFRGEMPIICII